MTTPSQSNLAVAMPLTKSYETDSVTDCDPVVDGTLRQIDQEVQRLEVSIRNLKSRRNILAPIALLPPELLCKIFLFHASDSGGGNNPLRWIRITHVSRHWRSVALDCPYLWSNLVFSHPKWCEEMLKRSKMANLVVKADLSCITPKIFEAVRLALLHGSRIHELQLLGSSATVERLLSDTSFEAPMLRSLSLAAPRHTLFGTDEGVTIPKNVLGGKMPYLRRVELTKCNLSWDSRLLSGLTYLKIHETFTPARPSMEQLISALEKMPALEVLDLQGTLPPIEAMSVVSSDHVVDLPRLSQLIIKSTVPECVSLFNHITIPPSARVHLSCCGTETSGADFSGILKVLSHSTSAPEDTNEIHDRRSIRSLYICHESPLSVVVQAWGKQTSNQEDAYAPTNLADIQLHLSWHSSASSQVDVITTTICKAISLAHLRTLRLSHISGIDQCTWVGLFGNLSRLNHVYIAGSSVHSFIAALREDRSLEIPISVTSTGNCLLTTRHSGTRRCKSVNPAVYFPSLKTLTIEDANFEGVVPVANPFEDLRDCLMERYERNAEIQELCIRQCSHLEEGNVALLKEVVTNIDWDEVEIGFADEDEDEVDDYGYYELGFGCYGPFGGNHHDSDSELGVCPPLMSYRVHWPHT